MVVRNIMLIPIAYFLSCLLVSIFWNFGYMDGSMVLTSPVDLCESELEWIRGRQITRNFFRHELIN